MTHPSLVKSLEADLDRAIRVWKKQAAAVNDTHSKEKERLARGIVRGLAQALLLIYRPYEHGDREAIAYVEHQHGLNGEKAKNVRAQKPQD